MLNGLERGISCRLRSCWLRCLLRCLHDQQSPHGSQHRNRGITFLIRLDAVAFAAPRLRMQGLSAAAQGSNGV